MTADFELYVNGKKIALNEFASDVVHDVVLSLIKNLHGVDLDKINKVEIS